MIRPRYAAPVAALAVVLLSASSCESPDCGTLPKPTAEQVAAAEQVVRGEAVEVEVELENDAGKSECVVEDGQWINATDDTA